MKNKKMTYATTHYGGYDMPAQRAKTKAIASTVKRVRKLDATDKGRQRNPKGQTAVRADTYAADGFLRNSFLPKLAEMETIQACKKTANMEGDFYQSLSLLAEHYQIKPMPTQIYGYPYNMALALWNVEEQLKNKVKDWEEIKLIQQNKKTFLTSQERYNTDRKASCRERVF